MVLGILINGCRQEIVVVKRKEREVVTDEKTKNEDFQVESFSREFENEMNKRKEKREMDVEDN